jgi:hypothetical protein
MVSLALLAGFMHILAKALRLIQGNYSNTLAALVYGATPGIFINILNAPLSYFFGNLANGVIGIATFIFGVIVGVTALENQHKIGAGRALFVYFLPIIIIVIVASILIFTVGLYSFFATFQQQTSTPQEEILRMTSKLVSLLDVGCLPEEDKIFFTIKNLDDSNVLESGELFFSIEYEGSTIVKALDVAIQPNSINNTEFKFNISDEFGIDLVAGKTYRLALIGPNRKYSAIVNC